MNEDMKQRLLAFADEEIARQVDASGFVGGNNVVVEDNLVTLPVFGQAVQETRAETWVLALVGKWRRISNFLPDLESDWLVLGTVPRVLGFFAINDGFPQTISENSTTGDFIRYRWEMYPRIYEPSQTSIPPSGPEAEAFGTPYPGAVRFNMQQRGPGSPGTLYDVDSVTIFPQGTTYLAIPSVSDINLSVSPILSSFERVR